MGFSSFLIAWKNFWNNLISLLPLFPNFVVEIERISLLGLLKGLNRRGELL